MTAEKKFAVTVDVSDIITAAGNYTVTIKPQYYLSQSPSTGAIAIALGQNNRIPDMQAILGDADENDILSIEDLNMFRDCNTGNGLTANASCDAAKKAASDFNDDGIIDDNDRLIWVRELSVQRGVGTRIQ